jgi:hypothetical protein
MDGIFSSVLLRRLVSSSDMEYDRAQKRLRETFLAEAIDSVRNLEERDDIRAAILTGSAAWGKPNPGGDLDILIITREGSGVCYRYFTPKFGTVKRRTEHGFIPRTIALNRIGEAFGSRISCSMIEQLKNGRVLFQKGTEGDELVGRARDASPGRFVIGAFITECGNAAGLLTREIGEDRFAAAILTARRIARIAARALLLARDRTGISKKKHEYREVKRHLGDQERRRYEELMDVEPVGQAEARRVLGESIEIMGWVLRGKSVSTDLVNYD